MTGRGSTLDLAIINPSLKSKVVHFKVDTYRRWSLHGTIKSKPTRRIQIGKWSDHKGIECKLKVTILATTKAGNSPVINYGAEGGWDRYHTISNERAPDIIELIDEHSDVDLRQTALNLLKLDIDIEAFGIRFRPKGISHKKQRRRKTIRPSKPAMFKYYEPLINQEQVPKTYNYTKLFGLWKGKGSELDLNMMRYIHGKDWDAKILEALLDECMKPKIHAAITDI